MSELEAAFGGKKDFWDTKPSLCGQCVSKADQESIMSANKEAEWSSGVYGEVVPEAFLQLLRMLKVRPGQRFYDLGSGAGKTVAMAAHVFGLRATGIELSKDRHDAGCAALEALQRGWGSGESQVEAGAAAELVHGSFFDYDISDADVIFTDSVMFSKDMMQRIAAMGKSLRRGARIVSAAGLPGGDYRKVDSVSIQGTWGDLRLSIFEKTSASRPAQSVLPLSAAKERCTASKA